VKCCIYMCSIISGSPSFHWHNLVNMQFICTKISQPEQEIMLHEVLSEFSQHVLPLPCDIGTSVMSERRQGTASW